jgi:hypothetical protein
MLALEGPSLLIPANEGDHPRDGDQRQGADERHGRNPDVERHVVLRCAGDGEHDRGSRRDEGGEEKWVGSLQLVGGGQDVPGVRDRGPEREERAERIDALQAAEEHECGARGHGPERERAAGAPAFAPQRHGAEHDERRVREQEQVDQAGVEPGQGRGEKPGVCAHRHAEQE